MYLSTPTTLQLFAQEHHGELEEGVRLAEHGEHSRRGAPLR
jgi:hypothetical protein